ncbi:galactan 1,3-beta-galactosidase [Peziza echinospora]|nr:galactan 1,3-beta-galactosidase [Peziza echinospora]
MRLSSSLFLLAVGGLSGFARASLQIVSGGTWTSPSTGNHIQAHGAGVIKVGNTFYLIGENKFDGSNFQSIRCYSSQNLVDWKFEGSLLTRQDSGDLGPNRVVERPKVIYNDKTSQYVLYLHIDSSNYGEAKVGVATGSSVCGTYQYRGSFQPLGNESRDMGLYKDDDGSAYLLTEDRKNGLRINKLSDDYLSVKENVYTWAQKYESPAVIKKNGVYFMFASQLTGWDTNDNKYSTATSLKGPWSAWKDFAPSGSHTHDSQVTYVLPVGNDFVMYMGDRWVSKNLMSSTYVWLPMQISGTTASLPWYYNWIPNVSAGTWSAPPSDTSYEGESSSLTNGATTNTCSDCSGSKSAGNIGGSKNGVLTINNVSSNSATRTTVRMRYLNGDSTQRYANVEVNGKSQVVAFVPTANGQVTGVASFSVDLNQGSGNTVRISGYNGGWAPDVDRLIVPVS